MVDRVFVLLACTFHKISTEYPKNVCKQKTVFRQSRLILSHSDWTHLSFFVCTSTEIVPFVDVCNIIQPVFFPRLSDSVCDYLENVFISLFF